MRRKKPKDRPKIIPNDIVTQMGGSPPPSAKRKNPPKDDPQVQARLDEFVADNKWIEVYDRYRRRLFTKTKAAHNINVGEIEFGEQVKLYKTSLRLQKYAPEMQARLKAFVADDDWVHIYDLCADDVISKSEAAKRLGIAPIEFTEQIRLYEAYLKRKGLWVDNLKGIPKAVREEAIALLVRQLDTSIPYEEKKAIVGKLENLYAKMSDEAIFALEDESLKKSRKGKR